MTTTHVDERRKDGDCVQPERSALYVTTKENVKEKRRDSKYVWRKENERRDSKHGGKKRKRGIASMEERRDSKYGGNGKERRNSNHGEKGRKGETASMKKKEGK